MTSAGVESASFQTFTMADDSMEISSEHGGLNVNDDIDIDIDFTTGANDEDYMLEDIESDVEFRESFDTMPQNTTDDVMVDDYNPSLLTEEIHDGGEYEQLQDIPDETLDMPEMGASGSTSDHTDRRDSDHSIQVPASEPTPSDVNNGTSEVRSTAETEALLPAVSPSPNLNSDPLNSTNTLPDSPYNLINENKPTSPSGKDTLAEGRNDNVASDQVEFVATGDDATADEPEVTEEQTHTIDMNEAYAGIMVSYQDTQYALFSSSHDDDSDSFFLKDRSITQEPISSFLKALRDILQEELADDDELCIAIDVLRLEFGERSAEIDKVTFEELIYLHQQLLRNDGIDSPEPLHFTLGTRPEFAKRFVGLLAGASEGKGLSELIPRDEESENYDDVETSIDYEDENDLDHSYVQEDGQDDHTSQNGEGAVPDPLERSEDNADGESIHEITYMPEEPDQILNGQSTRTAEEEEKDEQELSPENLTHVESSTLASKDMHGSQEVQSEQESDAAPKSVAQQQDEEDDLIDYGDEEVDSTKHVALLPKSRSASYEAINEDLRRRSISIAAENASTATSIDEARSAANGAATAEVQKPANGSDNSDEIDFDIDDEVKQVDNNTQAYHEEEEDSETHVVQDNLGAVDDYYTGFDDEEYDFEDEFDGRQDIEGEGQNSKNKSDGLKVITSTATEIITLKSNDTSPHEEISAESVTISADSVDEIDYEDDLPTTTVEKALEASNVQQSHGSGEAEDFDEIDYEDDDDEGAVISQSPKPEPLVHTSSNTPGKRQRSESMSEVPLGEGSQEAKRIRS